MENTSARPAGVCSGAGPLADVLARAFSPRVSGHARQQNVARAIRLLGDRARLSQSTLVVRLARHALSRDRVRSRASRRGFSDARLRRAELRARLFALA